MSSFICSSCGKAHEMETYQSINVRSNPELKEKVRNGSLFVWECPDCGQINLASYQTLYHDPDSRLMIWLLPKGSISESDESVLQEKINLISRQLVNDADVEGYVFRRVDDIGSLIEKVLIHDAGLDDTVIEMCKYITKMEMADKLSSEQVAEFMNIPFKFYRMQGADNEITLSFPRGNEMQGVNIGFNVYEDSRMILERNPDLKPSQGFSKVDSDWIAKIFR